MSYDPEDHRVTRARIAGPLVLWAGAMLALVLMGHRGPPASPGPLLMAAPCGPMDPGALIPLPGPGRAPIEEVHAS
jgi:hypothetical protein